MKSNTRNALIVFLLMGIGCLIISYLVLANFYHGKQEYSSKLWDFVIAALSQVAFVVLTVVILNFLWELMGGEPISKTLDDLRKSTLLIQDSQETGVRRVLAESSSFATPDKWMERLKSAEEAIDLMGYTLHVWTKGSGLEQAMLNLVHRGVKVRILIMDEGNQHLESLINTAIIGIAGTNFTRTEIQGAQEAFHRIATKVGDNAKFELRTAKRGLITCQICRTDSEIVAIPYLYSVVASQSPLMLIRGTDTRMFKLYKSEFDHLWDLNAPTSQTQPVQPRQP